MVTTGKSANRLSVGYHNILDYIPYAVYYTTCLHFIN